MIKTLFSHQWKALRRSKIFDQQMAVNGLLALMVIYFAINFLVLGFYLDDILRNTFPDESPVVLFNKILLLYFLVDLVTRFLMQEFPSFSVAPYLHLPIKKPHLAQAVIFKSLFSLFNVLPYFFLIPFLIQAILPTYTFAGAMAWLGGITSLVLVNHCLAFYLKRKLGARLLVPLAILAVVGIFIFLEVKKYTSVTDYFGSAFSLLLEAPYWIFVFMGLGVLSVGMLVRHLAGQSYLEDLSVSNKSSGAKSQQFQLLQRYGFAGEVLQLHWKLIWRNKRPKTMVIMSLLFPIYFAFTLLGDPDGLQFMIVFAGIFITGMPTLNYGQLIMGWESSFFDGLATKPLSMRQYLDALYLLFAIPVVILMLLFSFSFLFSWKFGLGIFCMGLFNIGVNNILLLWVGTKSKQRIDLGKSAMMNYEGIGTAQFIFMIPVMLLPLLIYFSVKYLTGNFILGLSALGVVGVVFILLRQPLLQWVNKQYEINRYAMLQGFRAK